MASLLQTTLSWLQFFTIAYIATKVIRTLQFYFLYHSDLSKYKPASGKAWALITGSSDGIGKACAEELCRFGFNVIIHGRNEKKLKGVKAELEKEFPGREVRLFVQEATGPWTDKTDSTVLALVKDINLTILINNVGGGVGIKPDFGFIAQRSAKDIYDRINANATFMTQITRVLIPVLSRDKSQRSVICNISSAAELVPAAYLVDYSATKAYVSRFSLSLNEELKISSPNIDVHSYIVGEVATAGSGQDATVDTVFLPGANRFARAAVSKLGCGHVVCTPYWPHGLGAGFITSLPDWASGKLMSYMVGQLKAKRGQEDAKQR
ncbi:hypothetical protein H2200_008154 [Cladophialophora chaetospira]|uniref:Very-long-chain 3-oxoacyl-CoA reductase n=1 Tax=Cladophialophora chaetospira TaxID=386627 RepID=A0AA38X5F0_9EURO|nr:hypothetical protein H2200_008154 [Cladophialophora chaetospira]